MDLNECLRVLERQLQSFHASAFFLNGSVGSGKSHLLSELSRQLVKLPMRIHAIGPIQVENGTLTSLGYEILLDCHQSGFLDTSQASVPQLDLVESWNWLGANAMVNGEQRFAVFLDLSSSVQNDVANIGTLFSQIRSLEGMWSNRSVQPHLVITGYWNHPLLKAYYHALNVSFPYTEGYNYAVWSGVSTEEMVGIVAEKGDTNESQVVGRILQELVGGHPGAAQDVLMNVRSKRPNLRLLLDAVYEAALNGGQSRKLMEHWRVLPEDAQLLVSELILRRHFVVSPASDGVDSLVTAGLARLDRSGHRAVLGCASWYVELILRLHAADLNVRDSVTRQIRWRELMPETSVINKEAYGLINDIENQVRNFATTQLCIRQDPNSLQHVLQSIAPRYDDRTGRLEDAYERSVAWKARSSKAGMPIELNPLIAYCSTRDLASIIEELAGEIGSTSWARIAEAINELSGIRDAVMHNQLIDVDGLGRLYELQTAIFDALSEDV